MLQRMKKAVSATVSGCLLVGAVTTGAGTMQVPKAKAQVTDSAAISGNVTGWAADDANGMLYAVTDMGQLYSMPMNGLSAATAKPIGSLPSDIEIVDGRLYIPLSGAASIQVVDAVYGNVVDTIPTASSPYRIEVDGNTLYYVHKDNSASSVKRVDLAAKQEIAALATSSLYEPDLAVDPETHIVYVGESGVTASSAEAYDGSVMLSSTRYNESDGYDNANRKILVDGDDLFFGGRRLNKRDLTEIRGDYVEVNDRAEIVYVKGDYVFVENFGGSKTYVHDRATGAKLAELPFGTEYVHMSSSGVVFAYNPKTDSVERWDLTIPAPRPDTYSTDDNKLSVPDIVTDLAFYDAGNTLLATRGLANRLLFIDGDAHAVEGERFIGSRPAEIELFDGRAYVALQGATGVAVTDAVYAESVANGIASIRTEVNPGRIAVVGADHIVYTDPDQFSNVYETVGGVSRQAVLKNGSGNALPPNYDSFYEAGLLYANGRLIVGEKGTSGSDLFVFSRDASTGEYRQFPSSITGVSYPKEDPILDGDAVYFANGKYAMSDDGTTVTLSGIQAKYELPLSTQQQVIGAKGNYVITGKQVFKDDAPHFHLPFEANLAAFAADGRVYLYSQAKKGIYRYNNIEEIKIPRAVARNAAFFDTNIALGLLSGTITFEGDPDQSYITGYRLYFLDQAGRKLGEALSGVAKKSYGPYSVALTDKPVPPEAVSIGIYSYNEYAESMHVAKTALNDLYASAEFAFADTHAEAGKVTGTVAWTAEAGIAETAYEVRATDSSLRTDLGAVGSSAEPELVVDGYVLPEGAAYLAIRSFGANGAPLNPMRVIPIGDLTTSAALGTIETGTVSAPSGAAFADTDPNTGTIGGVVSWTKASGETNITGYKLYFLNGSNQKVGSIGTVPKALAGGDSLRIPDRTVIPAGAVKIGVYAYQDAVVGTTGSTYPIKDLGDTVPPVIGAVDAVYAGDTFVRGKTEPLAAVVATTGNVTLGTGAADPTGGFAVQIPAQAAGAALSITAADAAGNASEPYRIVVQARPTTPGGEDSGTGDSHSNPDPEPPTPTPDSTSPQQSAITKKVASEQIAAAIEAQLGDGDNDTVTIRIDGASDAVNAELPASSFQMLVERNAGAKLEVVTSVGTLAIPAAAVTEALRRAGIDPADAVIKVTIARADARTAESMADFLSGIGAESVVTPVDFTLTATASDGSAVTLSEFSSFIGRTLEWESDGLNVSFGNLAGVAYDPATNSYFPVPTVFAEANGTMTATLFRQGFSYYTVVQKEVAFSDLAAEHYAKTSIETLANKWMINGYEDGTFQPENRVTRAEFAAMLTRALGLAPKPEKGAAFADVRAADWYAGAVGAAADAGLVSGYEDGSFRPDGRITRQEMAVMLANALRIGGREATEPSAASAFTDGGSIEAWASAAAGLVAELGIVTGWPDGRFDPSASADRAQSATVIYRLLKSLQFIN